MKLSKTHLILSLAAMTATVGGVPISVRDTSVGVEIHRRRKPAEGKNPGGRQRCTKYTPDSPEVKAMSKQTSKGK